MSNRRAGDVGLYLLERLFDQLLAHERPVCLVYVAAHDLGWIGPDLCCGSADTVRHEAVQLIPT